MSHEINIVGTDYARGDDELAGAYITGQAMNNLDQTVFVASYGNRSTPVSYQNLEVSIRKAEEQLSYPLDQPSVVVYGADRAMTANDRYLTPPDHIVYQIHGDMGFDQNDDPLVGQHSLSTDVYKRISQEDQAIHVLSLAATTEIPKILNELHERIAHLVVMGGAISIQANVKRLIEANFSHDPQANHETLKRATELGVPVTIVPLDTTELREVLFDADRIHYLESRLGKSYSRRVLHNVVGLGATYGDFYRARSYIHHLPPYDKRMYDGVPVHDLTAAIVQTDIRYHEDVFYYHPVNLEPNELGQIGPSRDYMLPNYPVMISGELRDYEKFWEITAEHLAAYVQYA